MFTISDNDKKFYCEFSSQLHLIDRAITSMKEFFTPQKLSSEILNNIENVSRELLINAHEHGNKNDVAKKITYSIEKTNDNLLSLSISDEGVGFNFSALDMAEMPNVNSYRSRGLALVNAYSDNIVFKNNGNSVTIQISIPKETTIDLRYEDSRLIIIPSGDLTASLSVQFRDALITAIEQSPGKILMDMSSVQVIDSICLSIVILFGKKGREKNINIEIENLTTELNKLFYLTRLSDFFDIINKRHIINELLPVMDF